MDEFKTTYLDPPWYEQGGGKRGAQEHYKLIKRREDMLRVIITAPNWRPAKDAHLWMWITDNFLQHWGMWLIDALGFNLKRTFPWDKEVMGIGQYGRGKHETLYLAVKGRGYAVRTAAKDIPTDYLIGAPQPRNDKGRVIHSAKPARTYDLIEARSHGKYAELFARSGRQGWESWGDQLDDAA